MDNLVKLPKFSYTELDFNTIITDVENSITEHPEYLENWNDFLETNAGRMLLELSAYIAEKVAAKTDWYAREMFISTATKRESVINILKLINYKPPLPSAARVSVNLKLAKWTPPFNLNPLETLDVPDKNGIITTFECIEMADDGKPNYSFVYHVESGDETNKIYNISGVPFYQGVTVTEDDIWSDGINNERFTLTQNPIIDSSIRITSLTTGKEHLEVDSFISPEAQQNEVDESLKTIPYRVEVNNDNSVDIVYGHENLVEIPKKGERLQVTYRVGGGTNTNIPANTINSTKTYTLAGERITLVFTNTKSAAGGSDTEDLETAKFRSPLELRTANKTVTNEDYIIKLENNPTILHATIVSKDNEPEAIFQEYGYFLPPLDTWIYICPLREGYEETSPVEFNDLFRLSKTYNPHYVVDYEDIELYPSKQTIYLKKYRMNKSNTMYVVHYDTGSTDWLAMDSYIQDTDYTINESESTFSRIQSVDGGTIPSPASETEPTILRVLYVFDDTWEEHKQNVVHTFAYDSSVDDYAITLDTSLNSLYPNFPIEIYDKTGQTKYTKGSDYTINWEFNKIILTSTSNITNDETVITYYADGWDPNNTSEENMYLEYIKNQKMLCVDNHIKDARYGVYDVVATVYTFKNMKNTVKENIYNYTRNQYNINKQTFGQSISKTELSSYMMSYPGVRLVEITYLGRDYYAYRQNALDVITDSELASIEADNVEFQINAKYNEILVLAQDEWSGIEVIENKTHGLILYFEEL